MADQQEYGNVYGLREYINRWLLERFITTNYVTGLPFPPEVMAWVRGSAGTPGLSDYEAIQYEFLGQEGNVKLWRVASVEVQAMVPNNGDALHCGGYDYYSWTWDTDHLLTAVGWGCTGDLTCDGIGSIRHLSALPQNLCFLTVAVPHYPGDVVSNPNEFVVAIGDCGLGNTADYWAYMLSLYSPDAPVWILDSLGLIQDFHSMTVCETDPIHEQGAL